MSVEQERLDAAKHNEILQKKILASPEYANPTSHHTPKAIILAGQPGAGKGGLAETARNELKHDVVTVDPDELRRYHPQVEEFCN